MTSRPFPAVSRFAAGIALILALVAAGCGSSPSHSSTAPPASTSTSSTSSSPTTSSSTSSSGGSSSGIPQGANAGDADSDNHGGPSDGDGNL